MTQTKQVPYPLAREQKNSLASPTRPGSRRGGASTGVVDTALGEQGHLSLADRFGGVSHASNLCTLRLRQAEMAFPHAGAVL